MSPIQSKPQSRYQPTPEEFARRSAAERWLAGHQVKLRHYAQAIKTRDTGECLSPEDLYQAMAMKMYLQAQVTKGFIDMPESYLLKVCWNEALLLLRKQRRYVMLVNSALPPDPEEDPFDNLPGPDSDNPENMLMNKDDQDLIVRAISSLPEKSQQICLMLYAGHKPAHIARTFGFASRSAVSYYIERIRTAFKHHGLQLA